MPSISKLSTYRTTWEHDANRGSVTYINTRIVAWNGGVITLNSGGWQTVTTKRKMCQAARQFGLRYIVFQRKGDWFVDVMNPRDVYEQTGQYWRDLNMPFFDGISFDMYTGNTVSQYAIA